MKKLYFLVLCLWLPFSHATTISEPATLRETLPIDTIAYIRIPHLWGFLSAPKGSVLNDALKNDTHVQQILALQAGLYQNIIRSFSDDTAIEALLTRIHSPIEIVFLLPTGASPEQAKVLLTTKLSMASTEEVNAVFKGLADKMPDLKIITPLSDSGYGVMVANPFSIASYFDKNSQQLTLFAGTGVAVNTDALKKQLAQLQPSANHPMYALENRIDTSGQGFFYWTDTKKLMPLLQSMLPPEELTIYEEWGLLAMRSFAIGWGVSNGKGRFGIFADMPKAGYREYFPDVHNEFPIELAGKATLAATINVPALEIWQGLEKYWQAQKNEDGLAELTEAKKSFQENSGLDLEMVLGSFGPEVVFFVDDVGEFAAIRIRNPENWQKVLSHLVEKYQLSYETREINGKTYHHLSMPNMLNWATGAFSPNTDKSVEGLALSLVSYINTHYYWVEENNFLILAEVPQALQDRKQHDTQTTLQAWLAGEHRLTTDNSVLSLSGSIKNTPRYVYYTYLQLLNLIGDVAKTPVDLFALPSALNLNLPHEGTYAIQVDISDSLVGMELTFENNPFEFVLAMNSSSVAIVGVLAAIAIPAYQEYVHRAEEALGEVVPEEIPHEETQHEETPPTANLSSPIMEAMDLSSRVRVAAEDGYFSLGKLPTTAEIGIVTEGQYVKNIELLENGSGYGVYFKEDSGITGAIFLLYDVEKSLWTCHAEGIEPSELPESCQLETDAQ
ncbi:pilin [Beggiatoa leptomitoformis]|uniref:Pilin n=1 Tax=Beggiatoa leptomitoformis TaxID=288004 RepID=A0A2N9YBV0_9GAMM|nr:hypothetical protein [Beggiatoa leptomitoformis]ALG66732.1 hypothetical protein AL038_02130 [Beggiatoa leptomitoformis]AUI67931.1 hypothetical protein BLE401_03910 [Beggiatoa leptomitoformis]